MEGRLRGIDIAPAAVAVVVLVAATVITPVARNSERRLAAQQPELATV